MGEYRNNYWIKLKKIKAGKAAGLCSLHVLCGSGICGKGSCVSPSLVVPLAPCPLAPWHPLLLQVQCVRGEVPAALPWWLTSRGRGPVSLSSFLAEISLAITSSFTNLVSCRIRVCCVLSDFFLCLFIHLLLCEWVLAVFFRVSVVKASNPPPSPEASKTLFFNF